MGGLGRISSADVSGSRKLIKDIQVRGVILSHVWQRTDSARSAVLCCAVLQASHPNLKLGCALGECAAWGGMGVG